MITKYSSGYPAQRLIEKKELGKEPLWIANLLQTIFDNQLIHGDLKAQNFLIEDDGACIVDLDSMFEARSTKIHRTHRKKEVARFFSNWKNCPELLNIFFSHLKSMELLE